MASIRDKVFTDDEIRGMVGEARGNAAYFLSRNKQHHFENYERYALALEQLLARIPPVTPQV